MAVQSIFTSKLLGQEKTKYILMGYLISISILFPGIIILGNEFGAEGIAISFVLSQTATAIFLVLAAQLSGKKNE